MKKNKLRLGSNPLDFIEAAAPPEPVAKKTKQPPLLYFVPQWKPEELPSQDVVGEYVVAVFDIQESLFLSLRSILGERRVVLVKPGNTFQRLDNDRFGIDPREPDHYGQLLSQLELGHRLPDRIIHAWAGHDASESPNDMDHGLYLGIYSLFLLTKAYMNQRPGSGFDCLFVHSSANGHALPHHGAVHAFARSIFRENPALVIESVELSGVPLADAADLLLQEFQKGEGIEFELRFEKGRRYVRRLDGFVPSERNQQPLNIKSGGVYLVTGGAGGLGIRLATYLTSKEPVRLVLTGRSQPSAQLEKTIKKLGKNGSEVLYIQSDISREKDVQSLIAGIKEQYGHVDGVLHCAGVTRDALLMKKDFADLAVVIEPKVKGTALLARELKDDSLDFFILCSSIAGATGNIGQCDYAFANSFLDCFARVSGKPFMSIGWSLWEGGGMQVSQQNLERVKKEIGITPMPADSGLISMDTVFSSGLSHCVVVNANAKKFKRFLSRPPKRTVRPLPKKTPPPTAPQPESGNLSILTEDYLKKVISQETKIPVWKIDSQESLEAYGIDSIIVNQFNARVEQDLGKISRTLLFECRTINALSAYFVEHFKERLEKLFGLQTNELEQWPLLQSLSLKDPESQQTLPSPSSHSGIAIIGLGGRYPGSAGLAEFWENLSAGNDLVTEIPSGRWDAEAYYDPDPQLAKDGKIYCKWGGFLDEVDLFDPLFFNISPKEAEQMDPQERLFLETVWETFEDAGYSRKTLELESTGSFASGGAVGVFVGVTSHSYQLLGPELWSKGDFSIPTSSGWSIANRISYFFNLKGPSMPVDTACSSSLVAIHLACRSIERQECRMAVAGGVNLYLHPAKYLGMCSLNMLTRTGKCHTFGNGSDGFVPGEGVGAALLKPLEKAEADGDHIYAVIKGSAINHGGKTNGFTVPDPNTQADLILLALEDADVAAESISYVEAHGTGTILGDPIEIQGLVKAFGTSTGKRGFCSIGSVKSNIGHLESAAGIAGLTKIVAQMTNRKLAPSLHAGTLNPNIDFEDSQFFVQRQLSEWQAPGDYPRRAGLSSFGAGGTNAHIIVEEYQEVVGSHSDGTFLFVFSAKTEDILERYAKKYLAFLTDSEAINPANLAYTLQVGREAMVQRLAIVAGSVAELRDALSGFLNKKDDSMRVFRGNAKLNRGITGILNGDEEAYQMIARWIAKGEYVKLAGLWVQGLQIDWRLFYLGAAPRRMSLPTYPFSKQRYWILEEGYESNFNLKPTVPRTTLHPLVHENRSTFEGIRFSSYLGPDDLLLTACPSSGKRTLNFLLFLEMARAAGQLAGNGRIARIHDIVWTAQRIVPDENQELFIDLFHDGDDVHFEISRALSNDSGDFISHGLLVYENGAVYSSGRRIDIDTVKQRCVEKELPSASTSRLRRTLYVGEAEGLVYLDSREPTNGNCRDCVLSPDLLKGAMLSLWDLVASIESPASPLFVPFNAREFYIGGPITGQCYMYVTWKRDMGRTVSSRNLEFDLLVVDDKGSVRVSVAGLRMRPEGDLSMDVEDLLLKLQAGEITVDDALSFSEVRR